jgi:hypothetical protein
MSWLPPGSLAAREEWSRTHPWIAGCYFGFFLSAVFAVLIAVAGRLRFGLILGAFMWPLGAVLFALLAKHRVGERADADDHPWPTYRRPWSRASDRFLTGIVTLGVLGVLASIIKLALPGRSFGDIAGLVPGALLIVLARAERKLRDDPAEASSA